ncbi:hypothetical protein PVK06_005870 [Gossypium arboreum]|uniref:Glycosyltransferase N-terminal domain-containing protein n=1 Tax=Gossypium arboreum TaxID=29729 RepID=A0ABR0QX38_GOSAR|nr:hypothetical protein PVK06_005870 [Gossypium arboreum]
MDSIKSHAECLPFPAQGHINPMMQVAKLLHSRGFHITFVNTEFNHRRLIRSRGEEAVKGLPDFRFEAIPDGLPPSDSNATQCVPAICDSTRKNCLTPFLELLSKLKSSTHLPPITCMVCDGIMNCGTNAAQLIGVPYVQLWTSSTVSFLGFLRYKELAQRGIVPFKDEGFVSDGTLEMPIDWIPGMPNMRLKDLPSFIRTTDPDDIMWNYAIEVSQECLKSSSIIFNTFDEFEKEVLQGLANSKYQFLWVVRPDIVMGESVVLPREFMEAIKGRGFITSWCPQQQVLSHPAVGVFLTHCEWNSLLEACDDVEALVKEIMEGDNGQRIRQKALEWKKKAKSAISVGGSSVTNFDRMIKEALHQS